MWVFPQIRVLPNRPFYLIGFSIINRPFWGTIIFGNTHIKQPTGGPLNRTLHRYGVGSFSLYPQGEVFRSQRFVHRFSCPMVFTRLPFDEQICTIKRLTFKKELDDLALKACFIVAEVRKRNVSFGVHRFFFGMECGKVGQNSDVSIC